SLKTSIKTITYLSDIGCLEIQGASLKLDTRKGYQIMGVIRLADGSHPPLGISVKDKTSHKELGLVADGGFVYLNGIQDDSKLTLRWGDKSCFIQPPNSSNLTTGTVILPCISQN
ncbi:FimD/PapC C-terminal domain-containing protein, partial [Escherichia coli]